MTHCRWHCPLMQSKELMKDLQKLLQLCGENARRLCAHAEVGQANTCCRCACSKLAFPQFGLNIRVVQQMNLLKQGFYACLSYIQLNHPMRMLMSPAPMPWVTANCHPWHSAWLKPACMHTWQLRWCLRWVCG